MVERHSDYARVKEDWYIEPSWTIDILLNRVPFHGPIHDPCCGIGTIPKTAIAHKFLHRLDYIPIATGADIVQRDPAYPVQDFLTDTRKYANIITNPPYNIAVTILQHALKQVEVGGRVCMLVQSKFLFSQRRKMIFESGKLERVIILSRRPSIPPGEALAEHGESIRGGGSIDFLWCVWRSEANVTPTIEWAV